MPTPDSCGGNLLANELLISLLGDKDFSLPDVDLSQPEFQIPELPGLNLEIARLTTKDLTERKVNGDGTFDALMSAISAHVQKEYESNRITGQEYSKTYIGALGAALQTATQFLLGKDQAHWQSVLGQLQAQQAAIQVVTARVGLETAKAQLAAARYQALTAEADYGLTKMKIATEDATFCLLKVQKLGAEADVETKYYTNQFLLPEQLELLKEQVEVARSQTLDVRRNNAPIRGSVGKQKELYTQQITSYQRDAEVKAAKIFSDAWITQKTIDEGLTAPNGFTNASLDTVLTALKINNNLT